MPKKIRFAGLHNHTHFSFLDSINKPEKLFARAKELDYDALAITDHGNMCGVVACWKAAQATGIKYIPGIEAYFCPDINDKERERFHITLVAISNAGYKNLCRLSTLSYTKGFYYKPRIDFDLLQQYNEGIVALSGCLSGIIAQSYLKDGDPTETAGKFVDIFGDRFFMEIWDHKLPEQRRVVPKLIGLANKLHIPLVATQDCHYTNEEHHMTHAHLIAIGRPGTAPRDAQYPTEHFYLKAKEQMQALFSHVPEAIDNTAAIADMVDWNLDLETKHAPKYKEEGVDDNAAYFRKLVVDGFERKYPEGKRPAGAEARLRHEIKVIEKLGFTDYFLILQDLQRYAHTHGIPTGPGRGSAAGSIVSYSLGITDVDPLRFGLLFERFLNEDRVSDPDIDMDFCKDRRQEVIHYLEDRYGAENVSKIGTFSKLHAKSVLRDVGRARGLFYKHQDAIANVVPDTDPDWDIRQLLKKPPDVAREIPGFKEYIEVSSELVGNIRHQGVHAAGVLIGDRPLIELIPLYTTSDDKDTLISQFDMGDVEAVGLLKIDVLGLETLTVIKRCLEFIPEDKRPNLNTTDLDDAATFELLRSGQTVGLFQLESFGMRQILLRSQPREIEHIIATIALYRPGPLDAGMVDHYVSRMRGDEEVTYLHPTLSDILANTYGILVYQEQIMQSVVKLCGYTMSEADELRRVIGKKKLDQIPEERKKFVSHFMKHTGGSEDEAEVIWAQIETFGRYGFNKPHAASYAVISYWTAYLKVHFPLEFMASLMTSEIGNTEKLQKYVFECAQRLKIPVLPPDINKSMVGFTPEGSCIRAGLSCIDGLAESSAGAIIEARKDVPFRNLSDMLSRIRNLGKKMNARVATNLASSGALDSIIPNRRSAVDGLPDLLAQERPEIVSLFEDENIADLVEREEYPKLERRQRQETTLGMPILKVK